MLLVHGPPIAQPLVVLVERAVVGFVEVLQIMPATVTVAPPLETVLPPPVAVVGVMLVIEFVVTVGRLAPVVNVPSGEYPVPVVLVA
jgi:hypothetical protein